MNSHSLKSRVWVAPAGGLCPFPELTLPEVLAKPEIGVCFSGGGARAMTAAMGQLRALNHLGIIPSVRYISCVSGGSWACLIFTYYTTGACSDADLLGLLRRRNKLRKGTCVVL